MDSITKMEGFAKQRFPEPSWKVILPYAMNNGSWITAQENQVLNLKRISAARWLWQPIMANTYNKEARDLVELKYGK